MLSESPRIIRLHSALKSRLLLLLLGSYLLAIVWPGPGVALREVSFGHLSVVGSPVNLSVPMLLLAYLLFTAGIGVANRELRRLREHPGLLAGGLGATVAIPVLYTLTIAVLMASWPEREETQVLLVGLALIGAMPVAGSSTAWANAVNGNLALSLGLVLASTVASPALTPLTLNVVARVASEPYAHDLSLLAGQGTQVFIVLAVVVPSALGLATRRVLGRERLSKALPWLQTVNLLDLLVLNYSNAAAALPQAIRQPDPDFLFLLALITGLLCLSGFAVGWILPRWLGGRRPEQISMMFGMGMANNGTALVLASATLPQHPQVLLPIIVYNLAQQIVAGIASRNLSQPDGPPEGAVPA